MKNLTRRSFFALSAAVLLAVSGCGHAPARAAASAPAHKARIVLGLGEAPGTSVILFDGARRLGSLDPGEWTSFDVAAGKHHLFARAADEASCIRAADDEPCASVGVLAAEVEAGRVYYANVVVAPDDRIELVRADAATTAGTRQRRFAIGPLDETDRLAVVKGRARTESDESWSASASSVARWHGETSLAMEQWMVTP